MSKSKNTQTSTAQKRQDLLYQAYLKMYKEEGEKAHLLPKSYFYERIADEKGYASETVANYIRKKTRERK